MIFKKSLKNLSKNLTVGIGCYSLCWKFDILARFWLVEISINQNFFNIDFQCISHADCDNIYFNIFLLTPFLWVENWNNMKNDQNLIIFSVFLSSRAENYLNLSYNFNFYVLQNFQRMKIRDKSLDYRMAKVPPQNLWMLCLEGLTRRSEIKYYE